MEEGGGLGRGVRERKSGTEETTVKDRTSVGVGVGGEGSSRLRKTRVTKTKTKTAVEEGRGLEGGGV